jgi:hypothetical protein
MMPNVIGRRSFWPAAAILIVLAWPGRVAGQVTAHSQEGWLKSGAFIAPGDLAPELETALLNLGGRMMGADKARVSLSGVLTDDGGSRAVQITIQAPGYFRFQHVDNSRAVSFDGAQFKTNRGPLDSEDMRISESILAHFPDAIFLQFAAGGAVRCLGSHFRSDDGKTPDYSGPYWTLYAFSPSERPGLAQGRALQQHLFVAIDDQTGLMSEVRIVTGTGTPEQAVTQTSFSNWFQQGGQWFPGRIVRRENGQQVLSFETQHAGVSAQVPAATFEP